MGEKKARKYRWARKGPREVDRDISAWFDTFREAYLDSEFWNVDTTFIEDNYGKCYRCELDVYKEHGLGFIASPDEGRDGSDM